MDQHLPHKQALKDKIFGRARQNATNQAPALFEGRGVATPTPVTRHPERGSVPHEDCGVLGLLYLFMNKKDKILAYDSPRHHLKKGQRYIFRHYKPCCRFDAGDAGLMQVMQV